MKKRREVDPEQPFELANQRRAVGRRIHSRLRVGGDGQLDSKPNFGSFDRSGGDRFPSGAVTGFRRFAKRKLPVRRAESERLILPIARSVQPESLAVFDFTAPVRCSRSRSTTDRSAAALYLMNGDSWKRTANSHGKRE